jgi:signal transduction histidine kinase
VAPIAVHGKALEPRGVMHLFRFLQEVFANIIKHAGASRVEVRTWSGTSIPHKPCVLLSVTDNGRGLGTGYRDGGRGMENLLARAQALDAQLRITSAQTAPTLKEAPGTRIELEFVALA